MTKENKLDWMIEDIVCHFIETSENGTHFIPISSFVNGLVAEGQNPEAYSIYDIYDEDDAEYLRNSIHYELFPSNWYEEAEEYIERAVNRLVCEQFKRVND